jgi:hypothetical protein
MKITSKYKLYFPTVFFMVILMLAGCSDDFFDRQAGDRITPDQHYFSMIDGYISSQGAIISLQEALPRLIMLDGLRSDMMETTSYSDANLKEIHEHDISSGNPYVAAADLYKVIINANEVLAYVEKLSRNSRDFDDYIAHYYTGELIGMRSWAYLTLVRLFNEAAYIADNLTSLPENLEQTVLPKQVMLDTLINQVSPYIYDPSVGVERVEIKLDHYVNTKALLGELYLEKNDYANAALYLKMACESYFNLSSLYKVDRTYQEEGWAAIFFNAEDQDIENLSVIPFSSTEDQKNPLVDWINYQYLAKPSEVLIDSFMAQIPAAGKPGDPYRGLGISFWVDTLSKESDSVFTTRSYITKYTIDWSDPFGTDIIISRAADLHLLLAEAYNRMGDEESQDYALMLLNQGVNKENPKPPEFAKWSRNIGIRGRAFLKSREIPDEITGEDRMLMIEDMIIAERAMELAFEGKRWSDLVRIAERRNDPGYLADKVAAKFAGTSKYDLIRTRLMDPANWYLKHK